MLGHEAAGVVEAVGSAVTYVKPGDHVITCLSVFCGECERCLSGNPSTCSDTTVKLPPGASDRLEWDRPEPLHGFLNLSAFAELMLVHEHALVKIRDDMPLEKAALIGCGVMTGFGAVNNTAQVRWGESVAVIGCGGVGMAAVEGAHIAGAGRVIAVDTNSDKLELARMLGATDAVNPLESDPAEAVLELTGGGVHHAIECLGMNTTAEQAFNMLALGGTATIVGMIPADQKISVDGMQLLRGRTLKGSSMGSNRFRIDMPRLVELYLRGRLHLDEWVSAVITLDQINDGFADMKAGKVVRSVIKFD